MSNQPYKLSARYGTFAVAATLLLLWLITLHMNLAQKPLLISFALLAAFVVLSWYDLDHYRIPNWISLPLIVGGLLYASIGKTFKTLIVHLAGAVIAYTFILALNAWWQYTRGSDGIGMGDAKLLAAAGAWLGLFALPFVLLIASSSALLTLLVWGLIMNRGINRHQHLPFGPFIAIGFWTVWHMPLY